MFGKIQWNTLKAECSSSLSEGSCFWQKERSRGVVKVAGSRSGRRKAQLPGSFNLTLFQLRAQCATRSGDSAKLRVVSTTGPSPFPVGKKDYHCAGLFEVQVVTPPKESLGIHALHPDTHNGDQIQVAGKDFVVSSLVLKYKLVKGRYERDHNRLDVQELSRYFLNMHLDKLMEQPYKKR